MKQMIICLLLCVLLINLAHSRSKNYLVEVADKAKAEESDDEGSGGNKQDPIKEAFQSADANGDGALDKQELAEEVLDKTGNYPAEDKVDEVFAQGDGNGDGKIDMAEATDKLGAGNDYWMDGVCRSLACLLKYLSGESLGQNGNVFNNRLPHGLCRSSDGNLGPCKGK